MRGEPADRLGQPFLPQQLVPEQPVTYVVRVVELAGVVVQPVHPDIVQQAACSNQLDVQAGPGARMQLLRDSADDQAVRVNEIERFWCGRVLLVQGTDFAIRRNPHGIRAYLHLMRW
jgi:hypothetical protein